MAPMGRRCAGWGRANFLSLALLEICVKLAWMKGTSSTFNRLFSYSVSLFY